MDQIQQQQQQNIHTNDNHHLGSQVQQDIQPAGSSTYTSVGQKQQPSSQSQVDNINQQQQLQQQHQQQQQMMIDLENPDLTYNQAKKIRTQVERDVELLRNRVRMLQLEEDRAMKKINDTRKKTQQILDLKRKNDEKFAKQLQDEQKNQSSLHTNQSTNFEKRQKQLQDIKQKQQQVYTSKKQEAEQLKYAIRQQQQAKNRAEYDMQMQNQEKKNYLRAQKEQAQYKINEYLMDKHAKARQETKKKMETEKKQIKDYEMEAQQLELFEAELLRKLQETQQREKMAFNQLETAMIDAAVPKKMRVGANQSIYSQGSGRSQSNHTSVRSSQQVNLPAIKKAGVSINTVNKM